ncbi:hypothetical protein BpHYR1_050087 [Brachionus plicatilis]|uniref:Uncharacterized protein n=1 Tax=Brachionus plicatilis TaxID=10195 RepID=A0A3M7P6B1_BRAPC|nr:hypothetical protein BpHYR1_050087 [Brachionus plicatilis]
MKKLKANFKVVHCRAPGLEGLILNLTFFPIFSSSNWNHSGFKTKIKYLLNSNYKKYQPRENRRKILQIILPVLLKII